jgi:DNA-binding PadR family transcriptional regulator
MPNHRVDVSLRPPVFHILLALAGRDLHGLGIAAEVEHATDGAVELGPGTLYRSLHEMVEAGLIREVDAPAEAADPRRKYYRITPTGRARVASEAERLERIVHLARERRLLPKRA